MREKLERFSGFPFSVSCVSHSSVDVLDAHPRRSKTEQAPPVLASNTQYKVVSQANFSTPFIQLLSAFIYGIAVAEESEVKLKGANLSAGIQKAIMKGIKSVSQLFSEREEEEMEIEIGFPTDVQHVAHIGLDGSIASELFSALPVPLKQLELAVSHA